MWYVGSTRSRECDMCVCQSVCTVDCVCGVLRWAFSYKGEPTNKKTKTNCFLGVRPQLPARKYTYL